MMRPFFLIIIILLGIGCKTSKLGVGKECREFEKLLLDFASKVELQGDSCNVFRFDPDSLKYYENRFYKGRELFFSDHRLYENMYRQQQLTDEINPMPSIYKDCISKITKPNIIQLFGKNYFFRDYDNRLEYNLCHAFGIIFQFDK